MTSSPNPPLPEDHVLLRLNPHCAETFQATTETCQLHFSAEIRLEHWLLTLIEAKKGDIPAILDYYDIDLREELDALRSVIERLPQDFFAPPLLSMSLLKALRGADVYARNSSSPIRSGHLLQAIVNAPSLLHPGYAWQLATLSCSGIGSLLPRLGQRSCESTSLTDGRCSSST